MYEDNTGKYAGVGGVLLVLVILIYFFTPIPELIVGAGTEFWIEIAKGFLTGFGLCISPLCIYLIVNRSKNKKSKNNISF